MTSKKRIIEVNGINIEIDPATIKIVESYKVGDNVKVLIKKYDKFEMYHGVIIGFYSFENRPTIGISYLNTDYGEDKIKTVYLHKDSKDIELCPTMETDLEIDKASVLESMDKKIESVKQELAKCEMERKFFLERFGSIFKLEKTEQEVA